MPNLLARTMLGPHFPRARRIAAFPPLFLLLLFSLLPNLSAKDDPARAEWLSGYVKLEEAGKAESERNLSLAIELYRGARDVFRAVRAKYPKWNPALLDYRISFCDSRIRRLEAALAANRPNLSKKELVESCNRLSNDLSDARETIRGLKKQLEITRESLERARREAARGAAAIQNVQELIAERDRLKQELAAKTREIAQLSTQAADARKIKDLQARLVDIQRRNATLEQRNRDLVNQVTQLQGAQTKLTLRLNELGPAYNKLAAQVDQQKHTIETLQTQGTANAEMLARTRQALAAVAGERDGLQAKLKAAQAGLRNLKQQLKTLKSARQRRQDAARQVAALEQKVQDLTVRNQRAAREIEQLHQAQNRLDTERKRFRAVLAKGAGALARWTGSGTAVPGRPREKNPVLRAEMEALRAEFAALLPGAGIAPGASPAAAKAAPKHSEESEEIPPLPKIEASPANLADAKKQIGILARAAAEYRRQALAFQARAAAFEKAAAQRDQARADLAAAQKTIQALREKLAETCSTLEKTRKKVDAFQAETAAGRKDLDAAAAKVVSQAREIARLQTLLAASQDENEKMKALVQGTGAREQRWKSAIADLQKQIETLRRDKDAAERAKRKLQETAAAGLTLCRKQETELKKLEKRNAELQKTVAEGKKRIAALTGEIAALQDGARVVDGLRGTIEDADKRLAQSQDRLQRSQAALKNLQAEFDALNRRYQEEIALNTRLRARLADAAAKNRNVPRDVLQEMKDLQRRLDAEHERVLALEQSLKKQHSAPRSPAVPAAVTARSEEARRERNRAVYVRGFLKQGTVAEKQGNLEAAVWNYKKVLEYQPQNRRALKRLGLIAAERGDDENAIHYLDLAFHQDPDDLAVLIPLGYALVRTRKADLAVSMLARAAALRPDEADLHRALGVAYSSLGWSDAAEAEFRRALRLNQKDKDAAFNLAVLLASRKPANMAAARKWYRLARRLGAQADPALDAVFQIPAAAAPAAAAP